MGTVISTYSRSQETGTFISTSRLAPSGQLRNPLYAAADPPASGRCPTARGPSELPARDLRSSKLFQVSQVVLIKKSDIRCPSSQHGQALDAAAECEALILRGVVADAAKDVGVDHAAAGGLDPAVAATNVAGGIAALAREAVEGDLGGRLGEREVIDAEPDLAIASEDLARERVEGPFEVGHRELLVDREAFVLEEDRLADGVRGLVAVAAPGNDDPDRRLALLHHPNLHRRCMCPSKNGPRGIVSERIGDPERVPLLTRGVTCRNVERLKVVVVPLDLRTLDGLEAERSEDARDLTDRLRDRMQATDAHPPRREGHVLALAAEIARERGFAKGGAALIQCGPDAALRVVQGGAVGRLLVRRERGDAFGRLRERTFLAA